jgi:hypothetical protein
MFNPLGMVVQLSGLAKLSDSHITGSELKTGSKLKLAKSFKNKIYKGINYGF